eukprot:scaffold8751_cov98-Isochrysis_galbana.AAC.5
MAECCPSQPVDSAKTELAPATLSCPAPPAQPTAPPASVPASPPAFPLPAISPWASAASTAASSACCSCAGGMCLRSCITRNRL